MKKILFPLLIISLFLSFCTSNPGVRAKPLKPKSDNDLVTGCYYVTEIPNKYQRRVLVGNESYFLEPDPIVQVGNFKEITLSEKEGMSLNVSLDVAGTEAWAIATEKSVGKKIAFVVDNVVVMVPTVQGRIDGGAFVISGNFTKAELTDYYKRIISEMYEVPPSPSLF